VLSCVPLRCPLFPYTTLFRSGWSWKGCLMVPVRWSRAVALIVIITLLTPLQLGASSIGSGDDDRELAFSPAGVGLELVEVAGGLDRKSTRLNSSHVKISYAVF